jgi:hypothetical protein
MRRNRWFGIAAWVTFAPFGGGPAVSLPERESVEREAAPRALGVDTIVRILGRPRYAGGATLREELSIGSEIDPNLQFGEIAHIAVGPNGSILVADDQPSIRQFGSNGSYRRAIGRKGSGPGEYRAVSGLGVLPDGRIVVWDHQLARVNIFDADGAPERTWRINVGGQIGDRPMRVNRDGTLTFRAAYRPAGWRPDPTKPGFGTPVSYVRVHADGTIIDTTADPEFPVKAQTVSVSSNPLSVAAGRRARSSRFAFVPFAPVGVAVWSPLGYFVTGYPRTYAVELRIPKGTAQAEGRRTWRAADGVISLRLPAEPVAVGDAERDDWKESITAFMRRLDPAFKWSGGSIPKTKAAYSRIVVSDEGRLWVKASVASVFESSVKIPGVSDRLDAASRWTEPIVYDVIDPSGIYVGRVRYSTKAASHPYVIQGEHLYTVREDPLGVQFVKKFRVVWKQ